MSTPESTPAPYMGDQLFADAVKRLEVGERVYDEPPYAAPVDDSFMFVLGLMGGLCIAAFVMALVVGVSR